MNVTSKTSDGSLVYGEHKLSPDDWVDNYSDEFFNEAFLLTKDIELSYTIIENTFLKGVSKRNGYDGKVDEHIWLLRMLCDEISKKSHTLFQKSDFSLFCQICIEGVPYLEKEVYRLKTFKKEKTKDICKNLNINEEQFWRYIHTTRVLLATSTL